MTRNDENKRIAVIGAGAIGRGIAQVFAQSGYVVYMYDSVPAVVDEATVFIHKMFDRAVGKEKMSAEDCENAKNRVKPVRLMTEIDPCQFVFEAVIEKPDVKIKVFESVQPYLVEGGILVSCTSGISVTQLAAATKEPDLFIGMHFFNPVPVMELVEVVPALQTNNATTERAFEIAKSVGKTAVLCRDRPGFVANRILMPMINEAISTLQDGVEDAFTIDMIMTLGMNHPMGPLHMADLIGLDLCLVIMERLHHELGNDRYCPCPLLRTMVHAGRLGRKTKRGFFEY